MKQIEFFIPNQKVEQIDQFLKQNSAVPDCGACEVLETITIPIQNTPLEVDLKVVNSDSGPYLDVVLYENGNEIATLPPGYDSIKGEYTFDIDGEEIWITVLGS